MSKRILLLFTSLLMLNLSAQKENISSYNVITINYKHNSKIFAYGEGQLRGIEEFSYPDYYELKGGIGYNLSKNHKPLIGIGRYVSYKNRSLEKEEFRVWLQDVYDLKAGTFKFENRVRAEKSWFYNSLKDENSDRIRLRYRLNISTPLNSTKVEPGTISANVYDEVFFVTTENPLFARNRVYAGLSYQIDDHFGLASGYLWQREFADSGNKDLHFVYLGLSLNIDRTEPEKKGLSDPD